MAISDRIRAEARRTIDGMQKFYEKYGDDIDDAEEREHRVARVEAAMEGCNGLSQEDKIQKTAENLFELTCSQERTYDALRREMKLTREDYKAEMALMSSELSKSLEAIRKELKDGIESVASKIESSGSDSTIYLPPPQSQSNPEPSKMKWMVKLIEDHPGMVMNVIVLILILVFISGNLETIINLIHGS